MRDLLEEILRKLCNRCPDALTKKRQKLLALTTSRFIQEFGDDLPIDILDILNLLRIICDLHEEKRETPGNILIQHICEDKIDQFSEIIREAYTSDLNADETLELIDLIQKKTQSTKIFSKVDKLVDKLLQIKAQDSDLEVVKQFKEVISREYTEIVTSEDEITEIEIDPQGDLLSSIKEICVSSQKKPIITSGYEILDEYLNGGFEANRVYMLGGKPGLGKSSLLLNFFCNVMRKDIKMKNYDKSKRNALVYITLENDVEETLERIIRILTGTPIRLRTCSDDEIEEVSRDIINCSRQKIFIKYMPPYITSTIDIFVYLSRISEDYNILGTFIDHIDLLVSSQRHQEKRHDLGIATMDLKTMATKFSCPVVVPSHINTGGYEGIPSMKHLQESRQKAQNCDTVILMFELDFSLIPPQIYSGFNPESETFIGLNIDKNRDGATGVLSAKFTKNLFTFSFLNKDNNRKITSKLFQRLHSTQNNNSQIPF